MDVMHKRARDDQTGLLLLHAPSVYDFRSRAILYGPVSDMVPSSTVFEMYPLGFLTIANYLRERGIDVRIVNLALRMMHDRHFDVPRFLASARPRAIGIDLHWLVHAHGALEVARICKECHPEVPVIMGGLSATYYHEELIRSPHVDFVLRGDSTEPPLHELLVALREGGDLGAIPNLTWKRAGTVHVNAHTFVPASLDYVDARPATVADMVLRHHDLESTLPLDDWRHDPIGAVLAVKGCRYDCSTCGASRTACGRLMQRSGPVFRSPERLAADVTELATFSRAPIYVVGDVLQAGVAAAHEFVERVQRARIRNEIVFEFLDLPPAEFLVDVGRRIRRWSLELSPESHDPMLRNALDGEACYGNAELEETLRVALANGCRRADLFFMIGLPRQTRESVQATVDYCEHLFRTFDTRLACFISPMGPFLDPGSRIFESPGRYGYRLFARTLEEHRQLLVQPSWEHILNYETAWMTRRELVDATYDAAEHLNELKVRFARIPKRVGRRVAQRIRAARELRARLDAVAMTHGAAPPPDLAGEIRRYSESTVCDKGELFWPRHLVNFRPLGLARLAWAALRERRAALPPPAIHARPIAAGNTTPAGSTPVPGRR
jgi:B12-binding domain/radical SAM domain protein